MYCLEILRKIEDVDEMLARYLRTRRVRTPRRSTRTSPDSIPHRERAAEYYDENNPGMRGLNAHGTWRSDWDAVTKLAYAVREDHQVVAQ